MEESKIDKPRTLRQNRALWKYCENLSQDLSGAGLDMRKVLKPEIEIPWTKESVCDFLIRPIMKAMYQKTSTTELSTKELTKVINVLDRHLNEKFNITTDFPSIETLLMNEIINK